MVELLGVEPMTYTMRTYRSSQLSYSPMDNNREIPVAVSINIAFFGKKASPGFDFFTRKVTLYPIKLWIVQDYDQDQA